MQDKKLWGVAGLVVGLLAGYIVGFEVADSRSRREALGGALPPGMGQPPPGMGQMPPPGAVQQGPSPAQLAEARQRIDMNQRLVAKDPKNLAAWIALGNDYFDIRERHKSIDAYGEALKLQPNNPDVLTDQGAMYDELDDLDKALANFEAAQKANPGHVQSAYNIGVILKKKGDKTRAAAAWKKVIQTWPQSQQAAQARQGLTELGVQ
jgi:tetratricopeptide (TPR) repeat protein